MRLVLHNPHYIWYKKTIGNIWSGRSYWNGKYEWLLDEIIGDVGKVDVVVTPNKKNFQKPYIYAMLVEYVRLLIWIRINGLSISKFRLVFLNKLFPEDVLISFSQPFFSDVELGDGEYCRYNSKLFNSTKAHVLINLSHYGYNTDSLSSNLSYISNLSLWSENRIDLSSSFFKENFYWFKGSFLSINFVPQERFRSTVEFKHRLSRALAIGTLTNPIDDSNFRKVFEDGILQPNRKLIYENRETLAHVLDCFISPISKKERIDKSLCSFIRQVIGFSSKIVLSKKVEGFNRLDRKYFSFDMVETFNKYKIVVCPEEVIGLPGIGAFEAMCSGCVLMAVPEYYEGYGMIAGVHYIDYDGSLDSLQRKLKYFLEHDTALCEIQRNSIDFAENNFRSKATYNKFKNILANGNIQE